MKAVDHLIAHQGEEMEVVLQPTRVEAASMHTMHRPQPRVVCRYCTQVDGCEGKTHVRGKVHVGKIVSLSKPALDGVLVDTTEAE